MSRALWYACAVVTLGVALAGLTGCGGGGSDDDVSDEVQVYLRNSMPNTEITSFSIVPAGSGLAGVNLLTTPLPHGESRWMIALEPGYYDYSGAGEDTGGAGAFGFLRVDEPVLDPSAAKVIELTN